MFRRICLAIGLAALCFDLTARELVVPMPVAPALPVEVIQGQQELGVDVPATASAVGMQFGLIGAIVGASIQNAQVKKAEERVVPLRDLLVEYRFNEKLEAALRAKLPSDGLSPQPAITVMKTPWDAVDAQNSQQVPPQAMVIIPRYAIDSNFAQLTVRLNAQIVDRLVKPNGKIKTKYKFNRNYVFNFPMQAVDGSEPAQRWTALGSAGLAQLLDQGIAQTTDMLVHDFSAAGRAEWEQSAKGKWAIVKGIHYGGLPVRQSEDWAWVRVGKRWAQSLQGYQPVNGSVDAAVEPVIAADAASAQVAESALAVEAGDSAPAEPAPAAPIEPAVQPAVTPAAPAASGEATDASTAGGA